MTRDLMAKPSTCQAPTQEAQPDHEMNNEPANFGGTMMRRGIHVALRAPVRVRVGVEVPSYP